ncbi:hypothetical protein [Niastella sp. OAS944]|uniref:hypothetical protein n=1 Tax=Niastella sp. OAS944 TaxID=2664089 RepID=UPI0035C7A069|nr:hypothetical protein [Chitinophagaceae bacterium OAS944]
MKTLILFLFLGLGEFVFAQDEPYFPDMRSWNIHNSDTADRYIFADTALVRVSPDTKQAPADTLFAGDNITVTGVMPNALTIRGLKGPWLKIRYTKNGEVRNGYVWQGLISCDPLRRGDVKFVVGIERRADSISGTGKYKDTTKRFLVKIKVVKQGAILAKTTFITYDDESANFCYGKVMSGMGLSNVQNMINITFSGEACGISSYHNYFAFTKSEQLVRFPIKENVSDAGAFAHTESFIFPNEKDGKPDMVIWKMVNEEATEKEDKNGNQIYKVTDKKSIIYTWDGVSEKISGPANK